MKKKEIIVNGTYGNRNGRIRKVIAEGAQYNFNHGQMETDNIRYRVVNDGTKKNRTKGKEQNMTRASFASWAKERLADE